MTHRQDKATATRPRLDPETEQMRAEGYRAVDALVEFLAAHKERKVGTSMPAPELAALVDEPLPAGPHGFDDTLDFFLRQLVPHMTHVSHPRFHAYIPCPGSFYGALGAFLAAGTNPFVGSWLGGASMASLELTTLRWVAEAVGYPCDAAGIFTSGGSMANLGAVAAARSYHQPAIERARIYVSEEGHTSFEKAALIIGFPENSIRRLPTDEAFVMQPEVVRRAIAEDRENDLEPFLISANAGTTNTGSIDPLDGLADIAAEEKVWLHADAAYGGFAALTAVGRAKLAGLERVDSLTLDPHKWLYVPMGVGCLLVKRRAGDTEPPFDMGRSPLDEAFDNDGTYLRDLDRSEVNFLTRGPELSRPARALPVWTLLRTVGIEAIREQVEADLELARWVAGELAADERFELVLEPSLSVVVFRHRQTRGETAKERGLRDDELMKRLLEDGETMLSTTTLRGETALRLVVMNHRTDRRELARTLAAIRRLAVTP